MQSLISRILNAAELHIGQQGTIKKLKDSRMTRKLIEMGCIPGTIITLDFKSPSGDPLAFDIGGYTLGLRISEAQLIEIESIVHG